MRIGTGFSQKQTAGMVPEHIMGKAVLKMNLQELQEFIHTELTENPALVLEDERICPACGASLIGSTCAGCGCEIVSDTDLASNDDDSSDEWLTEATLFGEVDDDAYYEPFATVAAPCSLFEHLKEQIHTVFDDRSAGIAEFLVDNLDEDGYLREPLFDLASSLSLSVPQLEDVLVQVQSLDPPGIAARSLQECLLVQVRRLDDDSELRSHAEMLLSDHWESVSRMKLDEVAGKMGVHKQDVQNALLFIRERLNPYPASMFRDPWQTLAPRRESRRAPDVVIRKSETGLVADVVDAVYGRIDIDEVYASLYAEVVGRSKKENGQSEIDHEKIRESVASAKSLLDALEFRKTSLRTVAEEIVRSQSEFILDGPAYLKPMTKKQMAENVGLSESTISRTTDSKMIQLPTGEVIPLEIVFDSALPIREMVRKFTAERINGKPLSDGEIAERLNAAGIQIARRTVAKYRDQLRLPSHDYRLT